MTVELPRCAFDDGRPARFRFQKGDGTEDKCLVHALIHRPLVRNAFLTALVVGTVLTAINQGNVLADGRFPAQLFWKIPLTYSVPYCVSTWAALRISRVV
ncbi:MAG: nitrate/nitrite transporter NrtS [Dehalococcoidia bacterium]